MIALGTILLLTAIALIWFRTPLTGTRVGDGNTPFTITIVNESGQTSLLWIAGLIGLLGIGLIVAGLVRPNQIATATDSPEIAPPNPEPKLPPAPLYCSVCKVNVVPDADCRCPSCGWPT
jgi:hypothetical protein